MFAASSEACWLGEEVYSLPHFLQTLMNPSRPILTRLSQKYLIGYCLRHISLRHFEKLKKFVSLAQTFLEAIQQLKRSGFFPHTLEPLLKESGSLKEYDLWQVWQRYEEEKEKLGWLDQEDLYFLKPSLAFEGKKIIFENCFETPKALAQLITKLNAQWQPLPDIRVGNLSLVQLFSLPTPWQETHWFCRHLAEQLQQGITMAEIGILGDGPSLELEACWQKLKNLQLVAGPSPFLTWQELPFGRGVLEKAASLNKQEAPLGEWLASLQEIPEPLQALAFQETLLPSATLDRTSWLSWLGEALQEKPERKVTESLQGLQWLDLNQGDYPSLKCLWVPFLKEGGLPKIVPSIFFQDPKDRSRPEWKELVEAFPDPPTLYNQKLKNFLYMLAQTKEAVWLTTPRLDSFGSDVSPSPFVWDFGEAEVVRSVEPVLTESKNLPARLLIERERVTDQLSSNDFHARLPAAVWQEKVPPMQEGHIFSPSQLEMYAQCPFKYFANRVLGIPQQKEYAPELDPDDRGTLFHDSMEIFMKENRDLVLRARSEPDLEPLLFEKLAETVESLFAKSQKTYAYGHPELYQHLKQKTLNQARLVLQKELEEARAIDAPLEPSYFEWTFGKGDHPPLAMEDLQLGGRIDRIDVDPQTKRFLIVDYKTGSVAKFKDRLLEGLSLQLPLYILAVRQLLLTQSQPVGGLLVETKEGKKKIGMVDAAFNKTHFQIHRAAHSLMKTAELEAAITQAAQWATSYVQQIRSGFFSAQPKECKPICDYKEICRYAGKPFV